MTPLSDVALASHCTMRVGGPARWFTRARTEGEVLDALAWAAQQSLPVHVLGGGSNVVVADEGFPGVVIKVALTGLEHRTEAGLECFDVAAGEQWETFVEQAVVADCAGVECLAGIPGLVGGTPVQNVGAYGQDVSETITSVRVIDRSTGTALRLPHAACGFRYRDSRWKHDFAGRHVITQVTFALRPNGSPTVTYADVREQLARDGTATPSLADVRAAVLGIRRGKGMVIDPEIATPGSCGSFFVNPIVSRAHLTRLQADHGRDAVPHFALPSNAVKVPAAWLIERAGFPRGTVRGRVGISPFQAQAIVNLGDAAAADVLALALDVKRAVLRAHGIALVPEPGFIGFPPSVELRALLQSGG